jgi:hypothetical protein
MTEYHHVDLPTTPEQLIACAARADRAKHVLCLFLAVSREELEEDICRVLARSLRRVPAGRSLRREKDRRIVRAVRCLVDEIEPDDRRLREPTLRLRDAERRSGLGK